jgi:thiamine transport system substrate-binding protein
MRRRDFIAALGGAAGAGLAGCLGRDGPTGGDGGDPTETGTDGTTGTTTGTTRDGGDVLTVATYSAFVDSPSTKPGPWVKEQFEAAYPDATLRWFTPEQGLNYFIQRRNAGVTIDADVYVGLNVDDLIRIDRVLGDEALLRPIEGGTLDNADHVLPELEFDPQRRAVPFDTGYISLVYDEREVDDPGTFDALLDPAYEGTLLAQNAQTSDPGRAFLLWTVAAKGEDGYLDYWRGLKDNDVKIYGSWNDAYGAYSEGERPIVVSYSTDQVYANRYDQDMARHQVGFLNDQGYANPEGMAVFDSTDVPELATAFVDWMLSKEVQSEIPVLNVQFPATDHAELGSGFTEFAYRPPETVSHTYADLQGKLGTWVDDWAKEIAGGQ